MTDHYSTLGVARDADADAIRKAYRKGALKWHPDKHADSDESEKKFREIKKAYDVLSDGKRRALHDLGQPDPSERAPRQWGDKFGFKTTGDIRQDLVVTSESFASLVVHSVKHGVHKNALLLAFGISALFTAGWWGIVMFGAAMASIGYSAKSWIKIIGKSPMVSPSRKDTTP